MVNRRVALVHRLLPGEEDNLGELEELCSTAGYEVVYKLVQRRYPHPEYNIGPTKLEELKSAVKRLNVSKVIFENELKPLQEYNLAKELSVEVMTRFKLILEIFSLHASSLEAKLQIKLAELKYELPRAKEKVRLAKMGEQPGFHGLGAYEADVYYEEIKGRIQALSEKLEQIKRRKALVQVARKEHNIPIVSLAGYTNAGKSTLFNYLTRADVEVSPKMFTTLSTKSRIARIRGKPVFISDTVGFIKNVPAILISAFMSTLKEISEADLILLLLDASEPIETIKEKLAVTLNTLRTVGVVNTPIIIVLNKIDLINYNTSHVMKSLDVSYPIVPISALTGYNIDLLKEKIEEALQGFVTFVAKLRYDDGAMKIIEELYSTGHVIDVNYGEEEIEVRAEVPATIAERVRRHNNNYFRLIEKNRNA